MGALVRRRVLQHVVEVTASALGLVVLNSCRTLVPEPRALPRRVTVGFLSPAPANPTSALWRALARYGWVYGDNLLVEHRQGVVPTVYAFASELVNLDVALVLTEAEEATRAARNATKTTPIVMLNVPDALGSGLVDNLARPGGNVTGLSMLGPELCAKQLELLRDLAPGLARVAVLWHHNVVDAAREFRQIEQVAHAMNIEILSAEALSAPQVQSALDSIKSRNPEALIVLTLSVYGQAPAPASIRAFVTKHRIPAIYSSRSWVVAGGLMSYAPKSDAILERVAVYVDRILNGVKPSDLPVEQPTVFDLVVNATTARSLGLTIPANVATQVTDWLE
jgi:putative ABC transport system substrate-binding protein